MSGERSEIGLPLSISSLRLTNPARGETSVIWLPPSPKYPKCVSPVINTWVPNCELGRIHSLREPIAKRREREGKTYDTTHRLAQTIIKGWKTGSKKGSPVDCLVISPAFELMGRQPANELREDIKYSRLLRAEYYLTFFKDALEGKQPGLGNLIFSSEHSLQEVSDLIRTSTVDNENLTIVMIDARSFENGGTLTIDILIGREDAEGAFYLFDRDFNLPIEEEVSEHGSLAWTGVNPVRKDR